MKMKGNKCSEDSVVQASTDLPPQVDGQLRCFCKLNIPKIAWIIPKTPAVTSVRVKWWGEDGQGTIFRPVDVKKGKDPNSRTTARYPVRAGPMQFATYLKDMSSLILEVVDNSNGKSFGQATVQGISQLSTSKGIQRKLPVTSRTGQRIADLDVSLVLEHLMASYDCNGSVPTSDIGTNKPQRRNIQQVPHGPKHLADQPVNDVQLNGYKGGKPIMDYPKGNNDAVAITANGDVVSLPIYGGQQISASNIALPKNPALNGGGDLLSMLVDRGKMLRDAMAVSAMHTDQQPKQPPNASDEITWNMSAASSPARGNTSILPTSGQSSPNKVMNLLIDSSPVKKQDLQLYKFVSGTGSSGTSMSSDFGLDHVMSDLDDPNYEQSILQDLFYNDLEPEAVPGPSDLIPFHLPGLPFLPQNQPAIHTALDLPPNMPSSVAIDDVGNQRPPSRASSIASLNLAENCDSKDEAGKKKKVKRKARSRSRSESRSHSRSNSQSKSRSRSRSVTPSRPSTTKARKDESVANSSTASKDKSSLSPKPKKKTRSRSRTRKGAAGKKSATSGNVSTNLSDASVLSESLSQKSDVDGLSVERLTLLGRVQVARVSVEILNLKKSKVWDLSSFLPDQAKSSRNKRTQKLRKPCAFFIEYQFPIASASRDKYSSNAFATEVTRVASRNIKNGAVSFGHRSMYPIMFDGLSLDRWWKSALVFRLFAREAGQHSPCLIGSGGISLKSILKSENLFVKREVEIPDSNHDGLLNSSKSSMNTSVNSRSGVTVFGNLKISVELASDHKDFATGMARTKLSEMSGSARMVPMGGAGLLRDRDKAQLVRQLDKNKDVPVFKSHVKKIADLLPFSQQEAISRNNNNAGILGLPPQSPRRKPQDLQPQEGEEEGLDEIGLLKRQLKGLIGNMAVAEENEKDSSSSMIAEAPTLHSLLYIEEGRNLSINGIPPLHLANHHPALLQQRQIRGNKTLSRNTYLACRVFWCNEVIHSQVCWNSLNPDFNFLQVSPVTLNSSLMERMKDNFMIVEVWDKQADNPNDKLIGLVKLSLHQFYLSFRDRKIGNALLKSQYPVMAIDNYMPIIDLFSGLYFGQLKVVLAMGSQHQISALQSTIVSNLQSSSARSVSGPNGSDSMRPPPPQGQVDHHFELVVEGVRGLKVFEKMIWGEADCFVQFFFPTQGDGKDNASMVNMKSLTKMKCFRTATTLCIPDPVFQDRTKIKLTLPVGKPVQPELLIACSSPGEQSKGLPFEVWCRYYHPNVRDQRIAQGVLPIAKLCAMVTMHKPQQPCVQSFHIHLTQVAGPDMPLDAAKGNNTGLMDVSVSYHCQTSQGEETRGVAVPRNHLNSHVCLTVEIIRAAGLKAAADYVAQSDSTMAFCADVGVNSYIRVKLPFLGKESERMTPTVARCFTPEFRQCLEFPCSLTLSDSTSSSHTQSLAEMLEGSEAIFEVWHQIGGQLYTDSGVKNDAALSSSGDVLLGTCNVPLLSLLTHSSGVHGWFPITQSLLSWTKPSKEETTGPKNQVLGGLELSLRFADASEKDRVICVGRDLGWSPLHMDLGLQLNTNNNGKGHSAQKVKISVELASFPVTSAVKVGHADLEPSTLCYVCYKLFDEGLVVSKSVRIHQDDPGTLKSYLSHSNSFMLSHSPDLLRYLREKRLEIQVWVTYSDVKKGDERPRPGDRLVGSCYIDLDSLLDTRKKKQQISGSFPLFNGSSPSLKSAFIKANIVSSIHQSTSDSPISDLDGSMFDADQLSESDSTLTINSDICVEKSPKRKKRGRRSGDLEASFSVVLALERAMHLPMVSERNRSSEVRPTTYVSYQSAEKAGPSHTSIFPNSCNPLWDYAVETRLNKEYLHKQNKNLVLKVWHKPSDASKSPDKSSDRVLGFVSVDLSPLAKGLNQLCGWYNIIEFTGQCRGQIKVSITPQDTQSGGETMERNISTISGFGMMSMPTPGLSLASGHLATSAIAQQLLQLQQHVVSRMGSLSRNLAGDEMNSTNTASLNNYQNLDTSEDLLTTGSMNTSRLTPRAAPPPRLFSSRSTAPSDTPREDSSKSFLLSTLRRQLADLDKVMEGFKDRSRPTLTTRERSDIPHLQPVEDNEKSGDIIYGSHSELSTIHTASSLMNTRESSAPSRTINHSSSEVVTSQELNQDIHIKLKHSDVVKDTKVVSKSSKPKLSDSGVYSAKHCSEEVRSGEECGESARTEKNMMLLTTSDNQSTLQSVFDENFFTPKVVMEEAAASGMADTSDKTQPFVVGNASNSESSQNSQGFALYKSGNRAAGVNGSPTKSDSTLYSGSASRQTVYPAQEGSRSSDSKTHLELLDGNVSDDESDVEEEKMFGSYHRYRDLLDAEEEGENDGDGDDEDDNDTVEIVPRNINLSPVLPDSAYPEDIRSDQQLDFNDNRCMVEPVRLNEDRKDESFSQVEASPNRNIHEGTSVWYSEASEEEKERVDNFEEVYQRNVKILQDRAHGENENASEGGEEEEDDDEWMLNEREVLGNQNVEEWLVHRSQDDAGAKDDDWPEYKPVEDGNVVRVATLTPLTPRVCGVDDGIEDATDEGGRMSDKEKDKRDEMKLYLGDEGNDDVVYEEEVRRKEYDHESSDDDTIEETGNNRAGRGDYIDDFLDFGGGDQVVKDFEDLTLQDIGVGEACQSQSETATVDNGVIQSHTAHSSESLSRPADDDDNEIAVNDSQFEPHPYHISQGARPKVRHMLSNVEFNSETSSVGSRRNSKGSAMSSMSHNGHGGLPSVECEAGGDREASPDQVNGHYRMNGAVTNGRQSSFDDHAENDNVNELLPLNEDSSGEMVKCSLENSSCNVPSNAQIKMVERKSLSDRNTTVDSAFVDGETSDGLTALTVNSSAATGGHMSYVDDSGMEAPGEVTPAALAQHQHSLTNGITGPDIPNFFMNTQEMQGSISALQKATAAANNVTQKEMKSQHKVKAVSDLVQKIAGSKGKPRSMSAALAKTKPPPNTDQAKRIAKIFSSKPS